MQLHPAAAILAHDIVANSPPGTVKKMRHAMKLMDNLSEKAHPGSPWPSPWTNYNAEQRKAVEAEFDNPIDIEASVDILITEDGKTILKEMVEAYAKKAPTAQGNAICHILDALE